MNVLQPSGAVRQPASRMHSIAVRMGGKRQDLSGKACQSGPALQTPQTKQDKFAVVGLWKHLALWSVGVHILPGVQQVRDLLGSLSLKHLQTLLTTHNLSQPLNQQNFLFVCFNVGRRLPGELCSDSSSWNLADCHFDGLLGTLSSMGCVQLGCAMLLHRSHSRISRLVAANKPHHALSNTSPCAFLWSWALQVLAYLLLPLQSIGPLNRGLILYVNDYRSMIKTMSFGRLECWCGWRTKTDTGKNLKRCVKEHKTAQRNAHVCLLTSNSSSSFAGSKKMLFRFRTMCCWNKSRFGSIKVITKFVLWPVVVRVPLRPDLKASTSWTLGFDFCKLEQDYWLVEGQVTLYKAQGVGY